MAQNVRWRNYGPANFDRTHMFDVNYTYDIPRLSRLAPARWCAMCSTTGRCRA